MGVIEELENNISDAESSIRDLQDRIDELEKKPAGCSQSACGGDGKPGDVSVRVLIVGQEEGVFVVPKGITLAQVLEKAGVKNATSAVMNGKVLEQNDPIQESGDVDATVQTKPLGTN